jgi:hypothetical protein
VALLSCSRACCALAVVCVVHSTARFAVSVCGIHVHIAVQLVAAEAEFAAGKVKWIRVRKSVVAESKHPVGANTWSELVTLPSARSLTVTIDRETRNTIRSVRSLALMQSLGASRC